MNLKTSLTTVTDQVCKDWIGWSRNKRLAYQTFRFVSIQAKKLETTERNERHWKVSDLGDTLLKRQNEFRTKQPSKFC